MLIGQAAIAIVVATGPARTPDAASVDLAARTSLEFDFGSALVQAADPPPEAPAIPEASIAPSMGDRRTWWWHVWGGYAFDADDGTDDQFGTLGLGVSYFIVEDLALTFELNGLYFDQTSQAGFNAAHDGWGIAFALYARWHVLAGDRWTIFLDGGAGLLGTTTRVPGPGAEGADGGTYFNFTPQGGVGFSYEINPRTWLTTGWRWYHISNARTSDNNPGADFMLFFAGVTVPF